MSCVAGGTNGCHGNCCKVAELIVGAIETFAGEIVDSACTARGAVTPRANARQSDSRFFFIVIPHTLSVSANCAQARSAELTNYSRHTSSCMGVGCNSDYLGYIAISCWKRAVTHRIKIEQPPQRAAASRLLPPSFELCTKGDFVTFTTAVSTDSSVFC